MLHNRIASSGFRPSSPVRLARRGAAVVLLLAIGVSNAVAATVAATTYFDTASVPSPPSSAISLTNGIQTNFLGFFRNNVDFGASCAACITATSPTGTPLGTFNFGITTVNAYMGYPPVGDSATLVGVADPGVYAEHFLLGSSGNVSMSAATGPSLLSSSNLSGFTIYATPGTKSAIIELDVTNPTSGVISNLPSTLYLDFTGTTSGLISLATIQYSTTVSLLTFNNLTLDWSGTASNKPYSPSPVPLPSAAWLLLSALVGFGFLMRRRRGELGAPRITAA